MPKRKRKGRKGSSKAGGRDGFGFEHAGPTTSAHNPDVGFDYARPRKPEEDLVDYFCEINQNLGGDSGGTSKGEEADRNYVVDEEGMRT